MIRMLFALFVTLAGLLAASAWLARDAEPIAAGEALESSVAHAVELGAPVAPELPPPPPAEAPAAPEAEAPDPDPAPRPELPEEPVVEQRIALARSQPFTEAPLAAGDPAPSADVPDAEPVATGAGTGAPATLDQDQWAALIRRMLVLYRRTGGAQ